MSEPESGLARVASATERIADALEYLVRNSAPAGPVPRLAVRRAPTDSSRYTAVNLSPDGRLVASVFNEGDAATTLHEPSVKIGEATFTGGVIDRDSKPRPRGDVAPGETAVVVFELGTSGHPFADSALVLTLAHRPSRYPTGSTLTVMLEPTGLADGRHGWQQTGATERPLHGAA